MSLDALSSNQFYNEQNTLRQSGGDEHQGYRPKSSNIFAPNFARGANSEVQSSPSTASAYRDDDS